MTTANRRLLTLNAGSSSLKAALYDIEATERAIGAATVDRIGLLDARWRSVDDAGRSTGEHRLGRTDHAAALDVIFGWVTRTADAEPPVAVAHRVVHGGRFEDARPITREVRAELDRFRTVDPDHQPQALAAIDVVEERYPGVLQIAAFDTAFHQSIPATTRMLPLPPRFEEAGVRRYGFHGLSCEFIVDALGEIDPNAVAGRVVIAHLGSGASLTAVRGGRSVETTMGFSPAGGLMMGTRTGDLDPGVLLYALREAHLPLEALDRLVNRESGLLGVSGTTADMRDLLALEASDPRAAAAIALFCYTAKKALGALVAVLGGLDTLVFTGGIGEHAAPIRERITGGLEAFGLALDPDRNAEGAPLVSAPTSAAVIRVMPTDENLMLARHARRILRL